MLTKGAATLRWCRPCTMKAARRSQKCAQAGNSTCITARLRRSDASDTGGTGQMCRFCSRGFDAAPHALCMASAPLSSAQKAASVHKVKWASGGAPRPVLGVMVGAGSGADAQASRGATLCTLSANEFEAETGQSRLQGKSREDSKRFLWNQVAPRAVSGDACAARFTLTVPPATGIALHTFYGTGRGFSHVA